MDSTKLTDKRYLGNGIYCGFDGYQIYLYLSDGIREYNFIALDSSIIIALENYFKFLEGRKE